MYGNMSIGSLAALRQAIAMFFQDRRVKVSLFLQDGIQHSDGEIALSAGGALPPGFAIPGAVRYYNMSGSVAREITVAISDLPTPPPYIETDPHTCSLGTNLYVNFLTISYD